MAGQQRALVSVGAALAVLAVAGAAQAGGATGCNCVPTGHQATVPGISVTPPTVTVNASSFAYATATASASASSNAYANTLANSTASSNGVIYNGGGSNWFIDQGSTGVIPNLQVEGVEAGQARRICTQMTAVEKMVAVQAVCLDDKSVPHPASQVMPDRDVAGSYEGEVYRCIAGTRMQYTLGEWAGHASFDHGQTITCDKGQALYHDAGGHLVCRVQKAARDCNERSLLRRYGAGIKVMKFAGARVCSAYRSEMVAGQSSPGNMVLDGGVGGVVR